MQPEMNETAIQPYYGESVNNFLEVLQENQGPNATLSI